jgi:hypothetical protein
MDACPGTGEQLLTYSIEDGTAPQPTWTWVAFNPLAKA